MLTSHVSACKCIHLVKVKTTIFNLAVSNKDATVGEKTHFWIFCYCFFFFSLTVICVFIIWQYAHIQRDKYTSTFPCFCRCLNSKEKIAYFPKSHEYSRKKGCRDSPSVLCCKPLKKKTSLRNNSVLRNLFIYSYCQKLLSAIFLSDSVNEVL